MKTQFDIGSGNKQSSDDDTTIQVQIGWRAIVIPLLLGAVVITVLCIFA